jgi:hypothetical protein
VSDEPDEYGPPDFPQQQREWHGAWWSVIAPLLFLAIVVALVVLLFATQ